MSHRNTTQKGNRIEFNFVHFSPYDIRLMKPAVAKSPENKALEDLGRATLQIVHDLKNQLNGLKLYATFLRKRSEREERSSEERETLAKLIAGLDRAASEMTVLVRYAQPLELRRQPHSDLRKIVSSAISEIESRLAPELSGQFTLETESEPLYGDFDSAALSEAIKAITERAGGRTPLRDQYISLHVRRVGAPGSPEALIEWPGAKLDRSQSSSDENRSVRAALAARTIEAHGGSVEYDVDRICIRLPLTE